MSGELWLAEGFTSYYEPLVTTRAGLTDVARVRAGDGRRGQRRADAAPGRLVRTAEEMSQQAPFVDAATAIDRTNFDNTFISYYTWGEAIGLGAGPVACASDRTARITLDDFMRALWQRHGKPGGEAPGYVDKPYTMDDLKQALAEVSGDAAFAAEFFARYIQGHEVVDYAALLRRAGLRAAAAARAAAPTSAACGWRRVAAACAWPPRRRSGSPAFRGRDRARGRDRGDWRRGRDRPRRELREAVARRKPGDEVPMVFERAAASGSPPRSVWSRTRAAKWCRPRTPGQTLTAAQKQFRDAWLAPAAAGRPGPAAGSAGGAAI